MEKLIDGDEGAMDAYPSIMESLYGDPHNINGMILNFLHRHNLRAGVPTLEPVLTKP